MSGVFLFRKKKFLYLLIKLTNMDQEKEKGFERVMLALTQTENGLEIRISEEAYGNIAVIGILEKVKFALLQEPLESIEEQESANKVPFFAKKSEA
jgi:hypothetical protein